MIQRLQCPICALPAEVIFSRLFSRLEFEPIRTRSGLGEALLDKEYEVRRCVRCDLHFQTWVMADDELSGWYSPTGGEEQILTEISRQKLHWFAHMTEEILVFRQLCREPLPVVLDFGCNWGKWASMALAHGCVVFAAEVNSEASDFCARRGIHMISRDQLPPHRFDFINVEQVMEHLSDPLAVARQLSASLKPGGWLKMSTPDNRRLPGHLEHAQRSGRDAMLDFKVLDALLPLEHVNLFTQHSLKVLAGAAGLSPFRLPFFKWLGAGQLWNVPRQLNRNVVVPLKRWRGVSTYQWFQK